MRHIQQKLAIARGEALADILFTNCAVINVFTGEIIKTSVAVTDGRILALGEYKAKKTVDLNGSYLAPSFIDGHFHIESSMVTAPELVKALAPHGTGALVIDPHEYANVLGLDGIKYVLDSTKNLPIDFFIMLPSCVPATPMETAGAKLTAEDLRRLINDERVAGIAELMNFPGVYLGLQSELDKIEAGAGKVIDGHSPGLTGKNLQAYALAGVRSDHESITAEEALEKMRAGMHILLREGSTERNLEHLIPVINQHSSANCSFATDDKLIGELANEGHLDHSVRKAIRLGVNPITAIQIATINTARHYKLKNLGAIAPRYWANFVVFDNLQDIQIRQTYKQGQLIAENGKFKGHLPAKTPVPRSTINLKYSPKDLKLKAKPGKQIRVIGIVPKQIVTESLIAEQTIKDQELISNTDTDILKMVVIERHKATGNVAVGFVTGFKLKKGAIASTVAHDAHNLVIVGVTDADILTAIQAVEKMQGGQLAVADGKVLAKLELPIAGLVSDKPMASVVKSLEALNKAAQQLGCELDAPFMTLSFLSLSPIPSLKLTDQGLIDATVIKKISLFV
jgi:adenine deaminase